MKTREACFLVLSVMLCAFLPYVQPKCVMMEDHVSTQYPVVARSEPIFLGKKHQEILFELCDNINVEGPVCCNGSQVEYMKQNFFLIDVSLYHCRACMINYKRIWCSFTCSPNQADHVTVAEYWPAPWNNYVKSVDFLLSMSFQTNFWESCKDNIMGSAVIKKLYPNVRNFLTSLQAMKASKPIINLKYSDGEEGLIGDLVPCEQMCYCAYCTNACSQKPPLNPDFSCRVGPGIPCWAFAGIVAGVLGVAVLIAVAIASVTRIVQWYRNANGLPTQTQVSPHDERSSLLYTS